MVKNRPHVGQAGSPFPPTTPLPLSPVPISKTWIPWSPLSLGFFGISGRHRFRARLMALDPPPMEKWSARISDRQNHDDRVLARFKWRKSTPPPLPERANIPYDIFYQHPRLRICSCIRGCRNLRNSYNTHSRIFQRWATTRCRRISTTA